MPQETTVRIGKGESVKKAMGKVSAGIREAQTKADHAKNVAASRDAADREVTYYGGGDMRGSAYTGQRLGGAADSYTKEAASLPTRDARDSARRTANSAVAASEKIN
jgi:hypothetical protein